MKEISGGTLYSSVLQCQVIFKFSQSPSNVQAAARQGALLASCMGFCAMHQLQLSIQNPSIASIAAEEMALSTVCSILARREVLMLQRGSFVRMTLGRFSHALSILKSLVTGNIFGTAS